MVLELITLTNYIIVAGTFGATSYFGIYKKARDSVVEELKRKKDSKLFYFFSFLMWTIMCAVAFPIILFSYLFKHQETIDSVTKAVRESFDEEV